MPSFNEIVKYLEQKNSEYNKICEMLQYEEVLVDKKLFLHLDKQLNSLKPIIEKYNAYLQTLNNISDLKSILLTEKESSEFNKELQIEEQNLETLQQNLTKLYNLQSSKQEQVLIEIVKNKGELANKLFDMLITAYTSFLKLNFYCFNIEYKNSSAFISVTGENISNFFEEEKGMHLIKLQQTEGSCYVFIYKDVPNTTYTFQDNELQITACRSSGAGGQHINKTESSIKILHLPTGLVGISQDERSQFQNKQKALDRLKEKVQNFLEQERTNKISTVRKHQLKSAKIVKTYNLDSSIVVNNNTNNQISLNKFLDGKTLN